MLKPFKTSLAATLIAASLYAPSPSSAALVSGAESFAVQAGRAASASDFLTAAVSQAAAEKPVAGHDTGALSPLDEMRTYQTGLSLTPPPPIRPRSDDDLFLWQLLAIVHSHREGRPFERVESGFEFEHARHGNQPSAVPLPGSLWLFVMGMLGMAGTRVTATGFGVQRQRAPAQAIRAAAAA